MTENIITPEDLEAIRARLAAASPAPWRYCPGGSTLLTNMLGEAWYAGIVAGWARGVGNEADLVYLPAAAGARAEVDANAQLIAHAPADLARLAAAVEALPDLLTSLEALQAEVTALRAWRVDFAHRTWEACRAARKCAESAERMPPVVNDLQDFSGLPARARFALDCLRGVEGEAVTIASGEGRDLPSYNGGDGTHTCMVSRHWGELPSNPWGPGFNRRFATWDTPAAASDAPSGSLRRPRS